MRTTSPVDENSARGGSPRSGPHPALYMMVAVAANAAFPVLFSMGHAGNAPILFTGLWQTCNGLCTGLLILVLKGKLLTRPDVMADISRHCRTWLMLASVGGVCGFALFSFSLAFVDVSLATILHEIWPLLLMFLLAFLYRTEGRYRPTGADILVFAGMAVAGVALVVLSHNENPSPILSIGSGLAGAHTLVGVFLLLVAATCAAARVACSQKIGTQIAGIHTHGENRKTGEVVFTMAISSICHVAGGAALCAIGLAVSEPLSFHQAMYAVGGGLLLAPVGSVALRVANLKTRNLGVIAISYATPLVALVLLWSISMIDVSHIDYLVVGATGIVAANLLINASTGAHAAHRALVVALWVFGALIHFTGQYVPDMRLSPSLSMLCLLVSSCAVFLFFRFCGPGHAGSGTNDGNRNAVPLAAVGVIVVMFACVFAWA